ncbi:MAG TPA: GTPase HflX [Terriglobales bacterium]|nr:GTPase HflX [Terriglobales bacterium]
MPQGGRPGRRRPTSARDAAPGSASDRRPRAAGGGFARAETIERAFLVGIDYKSRKRSKVAEQARAASSRSSAGGSPAPTQSEQNEEWFAFSAEESLAELRELATSAGAEVVGEVLQSRDKPDPATVIGKGKLEEIQGAAAMAGADLILFDHDLSPSQQRNIEDEVDRRVIDRTQLILDIFARHARTREGQLQVELAQLEYLMPRLAGRGREMSQLGGGIGTRGPGETQLETDRRKIARRIRTIQQQVENVRRVRAQQRQRRESVPMATVALVGYTNAGKSTLFNRLTQAGVLASSKMFATLDPTIRAVTLPSKRRVLLSDTVGFIRNLPHTLVAAFRATLEEVQRAGIVLHVADATSVTQREHAQEVEKVLGELEALGKPRLRVVNKIDLLPRSERAALEDDEKTVHVSAVTGESIARLLERMDALLEEDPVSRARLRVPQREGKALAMLEARARILSREYEDGVVNLEVQAPESVLRRLAAFRA